MKLTITFFLITAFLWSCSGNTEKTNNVDNTDTTSHTEVVSNENITVEDEEDPNWNLLDSLYKHKDHNASNGQSLFDGKSQKYFETFLFNEQRHGITMDEGEIKLYQLKDDKFELQQTADFYGIRLILQQVDVNKDDQLDLVIEIPSGGKYGSDFICFFYDPTHQKFIYDEKASFANINIDAEKNEITSFTPLNNTTYKVENFSFIKIKYTEALDGKQVNSESSKVTHFDDTGNITKVDTIHHNID